MMTITFSPPQIHNQINLKVSSILNLLYNIKLIYLFCLHYVANSKKFNVRVFYLVIGYALILYESFYTIVT